MRPSTAYRAAGLLLVLASVCSLFVVPFDYSLAAALILGVVGVALTAVAEVTRRGEV